MLVYNMYEWWIGSGSLHWCVGLTNDVVLLRIILVYNKWAHSWLGLQKKE
jgi:hypothetical protein